MNGGPYDDAYYRDLQRRLRGLLTALQDRLSDEDVRIVDELVDANECGLALETISDALAEDTVRLDRSAVDEISSLADTMGLPTELAGRLRPLIVDVRSAV
jgi:hypothetical protein